ncbi:MAG: hypothetical protein RL318_510 [Fibrobacterota bacterium]|jgi:outer membrane receptor protein involved in Fe transport
MNMRKLVLGLSFAAGISVAQVDPSGMENLSLADLMNIKLQTGSFLELDLSKSPLSMTLIKRDQISVSGSRNLSELLEVYVPGFQYTFNKWNGTQWGMRGISNDRNTKFIVLVNGHKINTESKDGFISETDLGLLGDIERVEVLRGPAGLVYGSGAIAGIVNIVTRKAEKNSTEVEVALSNQANMQVTGKQVDLRSFSKPAPGHELVATLGWRQSDGVGESVSRIYGHPSWPNDRMTTWEKDHGFPSNGSYGATPGNYRTSVDWTWDKLRVYARFTHQVNSNGAFFGKNLWPSFMGPTNESWMGNSPTQWRPTLSKLIDSINNTGLANATNAKDSNSVQTQVATLRNIYDRLPDLSCQTVDGRSVCPTDTFWSWSNGDWGNGRRQWIADAFTINADYELPIGDNSLKFNAAWDGATNRNQMQDKNEYEAFTSNEKGTSGIQGTFGERRYTLGAMYLMKNLPKTQLAVGIQERLDVFGKDLEGYNFVSGKPLHSAASEVTYSNTALFTEGFTDVTDKLGVAYGARWDGHTRTIDEGGTLNGKLALVVSPAAGHTIKLIAQTSTNNGTVDNYEHNSTQFDDKGKEHNGPELSNPTDTTSGVTNYVTLDELHKLKPERIYSFEAVTTHDLDVGGARIYLSPSVSYNIVQDLFAWAQPLMRVVNSGEYHHLDLDFEGRVDWKAFTFGFNHSIQKPINTDPDELNDTIYGPSHYRFIATGKDAGGKTTYAPVADSFNNKTVINPVKDQITRDGSSFYGMATHVSKFWLDVRPFSWMTLHGDARMFWGLEGRDSAYSKLRDSLGYNFMDVNNTPIVKLNAGIQLALPSDVKVSFNVYNILGEDNGDGNSALTINTLRWGQGMDDGLYAVDLRSYALKIEKAF